MHKIFGSRKNEKYTDRVGAYLIPVKDGKVAVVKTNMGYFLLGGGLNDGESDTQCIERECLEEIGYRVSVKMQICSAEAYCTHYKLGYFHPVQRYYMGELIEKTQAPSEADHELVWVKAEHIIGNMFAEMQSWAIEQAMMAEIKWLFFDVGSTLIDESKCVEKRCEVIIENTGLDRKEFYDKVYEFAKTSNDSFAVKTAAKHYGAEIPHWYGELECPYPDIDKILQRLSEKYKLGIIANQVFGTKSRLDKWGIGKYFDVIISSAEESCEKPDRKIFELALSRANCKPNEAVMIGDRLDNDVAPANKIGMKTIWVKQGFAKYHSPKNDSEQPDYIIDSIGELPSVFGC